MDCNQQEKSLSKILKQQDISQIIKHFSFAIQQRFEQIQKNYQYFTCLNSINYERSELQKDILHKYTQYQTSDQHEIKLLQKFVQRILQIFDFFRQKTDDPQILQQMSQKIHQKFQQILKNQTNYHFFVNNRPKTYTINVKPLEKRSSSNDFLSIVGPGYKKNDKQSDQLLSENKKSRTQTPQKRVIQVGKLFKYVFSVLKRGYLVKLRMQRPQKKCKTLNKDNLHKVDENTPTITVQGTCAILRNCSQKSNKENNENYGGKMLSFCKDKFSMNPLNVIVQNKKQFQITQKIKNRSISTNQYSFISSQNPSILKQSTSKNRQIDKKINNLYDILNIQKYSILKVIKQPDGCMKDQLKRNVSIENECKKFLLNYEKWSCKDKQKVTNEKYKKQLQGKKCLQKFVQKEKHLIKIENYDDKYQNSEEEKNRHKLKLESEQYLIQKLGLPVDCNDFEIHFNEKQKPSHQVLPLQMNLKPLLEMNLKTQENSQYKSQLTSTQNRRQSNIQTIPVYTSRSSSKQVTNILTDKTSNLIDYKFNKNSHQSPRFKSKSTSHQQKKSLKLNLPIMLTDKHNYLNQTNQNNQNQIPSKNLKLSQKSSYYLQNYHIDVTDDAFFVPLLPKKEKNIENLRQNRNNFSIKKNNLMPNFHPLNRCRLFRQKKVVRNSMMIPLMEYKGNNTDLSLMNGRVKNAIF